MKQSKPWIEESTEAAIVECSKLLRILEAREYGLFTWAGMVMQQLKRLNSAFGKDS